jgi:3D (Asp-Asp-Asp) domain-containing protein
MRYISSLCLMIGAMGLPVVAGTTSCGASCGKGAKAGGAGIVAVSPSTPTPSISVEGTVGGTLARVTAYWAAEGDYYTRHHLAATGVRLHDGHCAVDPNIIPYGSVVAIAGVGTFLAVDTGTAVIERKAAREAGRTYAERHALVVDLFFSSRSAGEAFASSAAKWAPISWWTPNSKTASAKEARSMFAEEDWSKIQSKQL